jgi:glycerate kinase
MKILIVPDSFKGSLSATEVVDVISDVLYQDVDKCEIIGIPIADGGEGTIEAILKSNGGYTVNCDVLDPLGRTIDAYFGVSGDTVIIEMAQASGMMRLNKNEANIDVASTYGTGQLLKNALDHAAAFDSIDPMAMIIGIGGSATNDGGTGFAKALGVKFYDHGHHLIVEEGAQILGRIAHIDMTEIDARLAAHTLTVMCDVNNPLTGKNGATAVYGPQKGLKSDQFQSIENGMENYRNVLLRTTGMDVNDIPGSGAAGGIGATLVALFGATLKSGVDTILDLVNFDDKLTGVDYVITGEGRIDGQTAKGKVPVGVASRCAKYCADHPFVVKPKVVAIAGCDGPGVELVYAFGIDLILTTVSRDTVTDDAIRFAKDNLRKASKKLAMYINGGLDENLD